MNKEQFFDYFIETAKKCYINVYGLEKWEKLSDDEKHDVVMILAKDLSEISK